MSNLPPAAANFRDAMNRRPTHMDTTAKPQPTTKNKHWTEVPQRVTEMHNITRDLINDYGLVRPQGVEWTPELFIIEKGIDTSKDYSVVRTAIRDAIKQAYVDDLTTIMIENGVTDADEQRKAFAPYESLTEAVNMTGVNIKRLRDQVGIYSTSKFLEASKASVNPQGAIVIKDEKALRAVPFDDEASLEKAFPRDADGKPVDQTISPDLSTSPTYPQTTESVNAAAEAGNKQADAIGKLNVKLWNMIADEFKDRSLSDDENKAQLKTHYKRALQADNFNDFVMKHAPIEKAEEVGLQMVKAYIQASMPPPPAAPPSDTESVPQPSALAGNPFKPAERGMVYVKMGIAGISGSGKTYTALKLAREMFPKGKIAMLCTEHGAAKLYSPYFKFDVVDLSDYNPRKFIQYIKAAESYGYDVLVIDSLTAEWEGDGGILSIADGKFGGWKTATPLHQEVIGTIQDAQIHIFCTMLSKMGYDQSKDGNKTVVTKTGMEPKQRKDIEGEFHLFAEMDDTNGLTIVKSRCLDIKAKSSYVKGDGLAALLTKWVA